MVYLNVEKDPFFIYKNLMKIVGVWPEDNNKWISTVIFLISTLMQIGIIITRLIDPYEKCRPYELEDLDFKTTMILSTALATHITFRMYSSRTVSLIKSVTEDWSSIDDPEERKIMKKHDQCGTYILTAELLYLYVTPMILRIISFDNGGSSERYTDREKCAFSHMSTRFIGKIFTVMVTAIFAISGGVASAMFWSFTMHLSSQCKILRNRFRKCLLVENRNERSKEFNRLIDRHNEIVYLCGDVEESFNVFLGFHISISLFSTCLTALELAIALRGGDYRRLPISFATIALSLSTPFLHCYASDYLTASCEKIGQIFIECNWYDLSKDSITDYSIVITRCGMPQSVTCSKFTNLNLSHFKTICKAVWSYISFLIVITSDTK